MNNLVNKLISTGVTVLGGIVGTKIVEFAWKRISGHDAPKDIQDTDNNMWEAITFTTIVAAITALIRVTSQRGANSAAKALQSRSARSHTAGRAEV